MTKQIGIRSEDAAVYAAEKVHKAEDRAIAKALKILGGRLREPGTTITSPEVTRSYLQLRLAEYPHEVFAVMWLDNRHRVIEFEELFSGTLDGASVYPREVVRSALHHNAAAAIFAHNHPSGMAEPSRADLSITERLKSALDLIGVRTLDHFVVGGDSNLEAVSFAERGLI